MPTLKHVLITQPNCNSVLATEDNRLPVVRFHKNYMSYLKETCASVERDVHTSFRLDFLRAEAEELSGPHYVPALLIFVPRDDNVEAPSSYKWVRQNDVSTILIFPIKESIVKFMKQFKTLGLNVHSESLRPYSRPNWLSEASVWLKDNVKRYANTNVTSIEKVTTGMSGCVLRAETEARSVFYMKAVVPSEHDEVIVACALFRIMPNRFRKPLGVDLRRRWMLMEDYGTVIDETEISKSENTGLRRQILEEWACIQEASLDVIDELEKSGVPLLDAEQINQRLEDMVRDPNWYEAQVTEIRRKALREYEEEHYKLKFLSYARNVLNEVSAFRVPLTLVHGDLQPVNVLRKGMDEFTFFDFEATSISFPLLDAIDFTFSCSGYRDVTFDELGFYLERWKKYESVERLRRMFDLLREVYYLISTLKQYTCWKKSEESEKRLFFREMGSPVSERVLERM
ncbi:Aminoglycoside phosphotransferase [Gracilaria domingensis]|nr:Aminoglycoside phosphotransferase [Gracilaria domingensis]